LIPEVADDAPGRAVGPQHGERRIVVLDALASLKDWLVADQRPVHVAGRAARRDEPVVAGVVGATTEFHLHAVLEVEEHWLVRRSDLDRIDAVWRVPAPYLPLLVGQLIVVWLVDAVGPVGYGETCAADAAELDHEARAVGQQTLLVDQLD